jgi:MFS family permease
MSHREILEALSGLLLVLFIAVMSGTVVATALPTIVGALNGTQTQYTWIVTATLLAATATTPIWGKLADLFNASSTPRGSAGGGASPSACRSPRSRSSSCRRSSTCRRSSGRPRSTTSAPA